jgi:hypothetical protein
MFDDVRRKLRRIISQFLAHHIRLSDLRRQIGNNVDLAELPSPTMSCTWGTGRASPVDLKIVAETAVAQVQPLDTKKNQRPG